MPFEIWLKSLPENASRNVQSDLSVIESDHLPFLSTERARYQVERLSLHLSALPHSIRLAAIRYSLYVRQLDALQEHQLAIRSFCSHHCQRPPVGCCNAEHHIIVSCSDLLFTNTSHDALHLAHVLTGMQHREHEHALQQGRTLRHGYCNRLTSTGCSLLMFKSSRCIHYLCPETISGIVAVYGIKSGKFIDDMQKMNKKIIVNLHDFTSIKLIDTAKKIFQQVHLI